MADNIIKRIYCKQAVFLQPADKPLLQAKLSECLATMKTVGARKEVLGEDGRYVRALIYHRSYAGMLFGVLASYEIGTHQLAVVDDDEAEMLTVAQVAPAISQDNKRQEFLEGVCYFGVFRNHMVLVPSRALGVKPAEQYCNWLLQRAGQLAPDNRLGLSDQISQATKEKIRASHVKQVEIGTPLLSPSASPLFAQPSADITAVEYSGLGIDILRQLLGSKMDGMQLADAIDGNIEVTLKVRYKRTTTDKAHKVMDNIALAVRNLDEDEVKLTLASGGTVQGNDLKLSAPISVQARDGIPDPDQLFEKMRSWLMQQIEHHIIEP